MKHLNNKNLSKNKNGERIFETKYSISWLPKFLILIDDFDLPFPYDHLKLRKKPLGTLIQNLIVMFTNEPKFKCWRNGSLILMSLSDSYIKTEESKLINPKIIQQITRPLKSSKWDSETNKEVLMGYRRK
jgi:hypothetical protein